MPTQAPGAARDVLFHAIVYRGYCVVALAEDDAALVARAREMEAAFFALDPSEKKACALKGLMGYYGDPDADQSFQFRDDTDPDSPWPSPRALPGFKDTMMRYYQLMDALCRTVTQTVWAGLGLPPGVARALGDPPAGELAAGDFGSSVVKLFRYKSSKAGPRGAGEVRSDLMATHVDRSVVSAIPPNTASPARQTAYFTYINTATEIIVKRKLYAI